MCEINKEYLNTAYIYLYDTDRIDLSSASQGVCLAMSSERYDKVNAMAHERGLKQQLAAAHVLNCGLQRYGMRERDMHYSYNKHGKPCFMDYPDLTFSLSHSGHYATAAFICGTKPLDIGVDIEEISRANINVARRFFTENECAYILKEEDEEAQREMFCRLWTIKESFVKAVGKGLQIPLNEFEVVIVAYNSTNDSANNCTNNRVDTPFIRARVCDGATNGEQQRSETTGRNNSLYWLSDKIVIRHQVNDKVYKVYQQKLTSGYWLALCVEELPEMTVCAVNELLDDVYYRHV